MEQQQNNKWSNNKWIFPVRMENSRSITWEPDIITALEKFKAPVTQTSWNTCLRRGSLKAETPEQNILLRQWWTEGWKETPQIPSSRSRISVMRIGENILGETLEKVYPSLRVAAEDLETTPEAIKAILQETTPNTLFEGRLCPLRPVAAKELPYPPYTLFAADNTIEAYFNTRQELANYLGVPKKLLDAAHDTAYNRLGSGRWFWYENWGFFPISPDDECLGANWREKYSQK